MSWFATWLDREVVEVSGHSTAMFLQTQVHRDVLALRDGESVWGWVLSSHGTADAFVRATRVSQDVWVLDTDAGWGDALLERLKSGEGAVRLDFRRPRWKALRLVFTGMVNTGAEDAVVAAWVNWWPWPPLGAIDLLGPDPAVPADFPVVGPDEYEAVRIRSWFPKMGTEITPATLPAETGLTRWSVWYEPERDQEMRQPLENVPTTRHLRGLRLTGPVAPSTRLFDGEGTEVGVVTSSAFDRRCGWVGLGYVHRLADSDVLTTGEGGPTALVRAEPG